MSQRKPICIQRYNAQIKVHFEDSGKHYFEVVRKWNVYGARKFYCRQICVSCKSYGLNAFEATMSHTAEKTQNKNRFLSSKSTSENITQLIAHKPNTWGKRSNNRRRLDSMTKILGYANVILNLNKKNSVIS